MGQALPLDQQGFRVLDEFLDADEAVWMAYLAFLKTFLSFLLFVVLEPGCCVQIYHSLLVSAAAAQYAHLLSQSAITIACC